MSPLLRSDFVEIGLSVPTDSLIQWASDQVAATKGRETRLESRGVNAAYIAGLRDLIGTVGKRRDELGEGREAPPQAVAHAERIRIEALSFWREAKRLARTAFATDPDLLAKFRTGVETGLLLQNLIRELDSMIVLLREHSAELSPYGGSEAFITRGESLVKRLREVKVNVDDACKDLPELAARQVHDKGVLYDRTRLLVRVGRLEYQLDRDQASRFNFKKVRREPGAALKKSSRRTGV